MRRVFEEISDDEWDRHDFQPSRVLKKSKNSSKPTHSPLPTIESFAYRSSLPSHSVIAIDDTTSTSSSSTDEPIRENNHIQHHRNDVDVLSLLEDDDVVNSHSPKISSRLRANRGRRRRVVVVDDDDDEEGPKDFGEGWCTEDNEELSYEEDESDGEEGKEGETRSLEDLVGKALRKCSKISADLRKELFGSEVESCDRYAEVESSSAKIVTQEDISVACATKDSDFEPTLKPYQLVGVNFLLLLYRKKIGGAILADEMGLGKTVQAVTYLTMLKHLNNDPGPHLIVCPASVLENWQRELRRRPPPFNVLVVCYSLFERRSEQQKDDRKALRRWQWSCVLMDEAHVLKDKNSYRWKNLMSVAKHACQRLMLTGTPLQNDLHELWSLLEFMLPDIFATGDVDLKKLFNTEDKDLISHIKSILGPFILRRLKLDVMQQLVPKMHHIKYVNMGTKQLNNYKAAIEEYRVAAQARIGKSSMGLSNVLQQLPKRQISNYFMQFRKIANHPLLVRHIYSDEDVVHVARMLYPKGAFGFECTVDKAIKVLKSYSDYQIHQLLISYGEAGTSGALTDEDVLSSAKCQALAELLPKLARGGHRALIFSQWTSMLDILEWVLEVIGVTYRRLDGSTQVLERQAIVDSFNNDSNIFACLLSTRAGGQGLNLIGADTVIIHDMDFNPHMDRQAEDRCHRIGQSKPVSVYRLVTKDTVDENIYEIARRKLVLDAAVLESGAEVADDNEVPEKTMGEILSALLLRNT